MLGRRFIELYAKDNRLVRGLAAAQKRLQAFGASVRQIGTRVAAIGTAAFAPLAAAARQFAVQGAGLDDMSKRTGIAAKALGQLGYAAQLSGTTLPVVENGIKRMQRTIGDATDGMASASDALAALGVSAAELAGLSPEQQFLRLADGIAAIEDPTLRAARAQEVFGRAGTELLGMMEEGSQGIARLRREAQELGIVLSNADVAQAAELDDQFEKIGIQLKAAFMQIGAALAQPATALAKAVSGVLKQVVGWITQNKQLVVTVLKVAAAVVAGGASLVVLGTLISGVGAALGVVGSVITGVGAAIAVLGSILAALVSPIGLVVAGVVALGGYLVYASGAGGKALDWLAGRFEALKADALVAFGAIGDALAAGDLALAGKILWLTLKLEWQKGVDFLMQAWTKFKTAFLQVGTDAFYGLAIIFNNVLAGLEVAWVESTSFLADAWTRFTGRVTKGWNSAVGFLRKTWARFKGLFDESIDVEAEVQRIDQEVAQHNAAQQQETEATLARREDERAARRQSIERDRAGAEQELASSADEVNARRAADARADIEASEQALEAARREWLEAIEQAAQKRKAADEPGPEGPAEFQPPDITAVLGDLEDSLAGAQQRTLDVQGTFNAAAVGGLAAAGPADRIAKATEETAHGVQRLVRHADHGGLVFE